jgi:hypothetical protein
MEKEKLRSRSYRDLEVWKLSIDLVKEIYRITGEFPVSELYGLTNQVRAGGCFNSSQYCGRAGQEFP